MIADIDVTGALVQLGPHEINRDNWDWDEIDRNPFWCPDPEAAKMWEDYLDGVRKAGSSCGAVIEVTARNVPVGLGAPIYGKLDADLAAAMMSINAVKGVEIGEGFAAAALSGEENADEIRAGDGSPEFQSNKAGGILGGISTGQDIAVRFAVKPTSSILTPRQTIDREGAETEIVTKGRHDPCVGIRAVPVGEAMMALVLADHCCGIEAKTVETMTPRLYLISPADIELDALCTPIFEEAVSAGDVACFQLRLKDKHDVAAPDADILGGLHPLLPIAHAHGVAFLVNDRPDLAKLAGADGVHIGQSDTPYADARALLGDEAIIGVTCHNSRHLAMVAGKRVQIMLLLARFTRHGPNLRSPRPIPVCYAGGRKLWSRPASP